MATISTDSLHSTKGADANIFAMQLDVFLTERQIEGDLRKRLERVCETHEETFLKHCLDFLKPSANYLREIFRLIDEISRRDKVCVNALFSTAEEVLLFSSDSKLSPKDRQKELRKILERQRFPERSRIQSELDGCVKSLTRSSGLKVLLPEELEGDTLEMTIQFRAPQQLGEIAAKLEQVATSPELERIFALLRGQL